MFQRLKTQGNTSSLKSRQNPPLLFSKSSGQVATHGPQRILTLGLKASSVTVRCICTKSGYPGGSTQMCFDDDKGRKKQFGPWRDRQAAYDINMAQAPTQAKGLMRQRPISGCNSLWKQAAARPAHLQELTNHSGTRVSRVSPQPSGIISLLFILSLSQSDLL